MIRISRFVAAIAAFVAVFAVAQPAAAQAPSNFTLQPGGKAVITYEAYCVEFGEVFPGSLQSPNGLVNDQARAALAYGVSKGYNTDPAKALGMQYAIWQAIGAANVPKGDATTQDVLTNGKAVPVNPQGTSVLDAVKNNQVKLTLGAFAPVGSKVQITPTASDNFYGRGDLTIENTSQQALTLYMPVGTQFPSVDAKQQTLAGFATNVQVTNPVKSDPAPTQLPATGSGELNAVLPLFALALLALGSAVGFARRRA